MSEAPALEHLSSGNARDIYAVGEDRLLLRASDRISTYDVVHPTPIPDKGKVLTGLTAFWLELKRVGSGSTAKNERPARSSGASGSLADRDETLARAGR